MFPGLDLNLLFNTLLKELSFYYLLFFTTEYTELINYYYYIVTVILPFDEKYVLSEIT